VIGEPSALSMSAEQLEHHQIERIRWTLVRAYEEVGHYASGFDTAHVAPDDFEAVADLSRFPLLTDEELTAAPLSLIAVPMTAILRVVDDGAYTTGLTFQDVKSSSDLVARTLFAVGVRSGDRVVVALSGADATVVQEGAEELGCSVLRTHRKAEWFDADFRIGSDGLEMVSIPALGGPGLGVAGEDGVHIWEDHFVPEIVDGELVVTTIMRQAMPLVRYCTGLHGELAPGTTYPQFRRFIEHGPTR
jgi:phenylacetate-CoA ligase